MKSQITRPIQTLLLVTAVVVLLYSGFEFYMQDALPDEDVAGELIDSSLDQAEALYQEISETFHQETLQLSQQIRNRLTESTSQQVIHAEMQRFPFWGSFLYRDQNLISWEGFVLRTLPDLGDLPDDSLHVDIYRQNNITFLLGTVSFTLGEDRFSLFTTRRLEQNNVIPIAREQEYNLTEHPDLQGMYPVTFTFFDPPPGEVTDIRQLDRDSDISGYVYADEEEFEAYVAGIESDISRVRTLFHTMLFILGASLFFFWSWSLRSWTSLLLQLTVILFAWTIFARSEIPVQWIPQFFPDKEGVELMSLSAISFYTIHAIFTSFVAFSLITTLTRKWKLSSPEKHFQTFIYTLLLGAVNVVVIIFFLNTTFETAMSARIWLLDLELIPDLASWILFISTGIFLSAVAALLTSSWWFLFINERDKTTVIVVIAGFSFVVFYFIAEQFTSLSLFEGWKILLSVALFITFIGSAVYIYRNPRAFLQMSGFRLLLLCTLLTSTAGYVIYARAYSMQMDEQLITTATEFAAEEDESAREATYELLMTLERELRHLSAGDIENRRSSVGAQFQRTLLNSLREEWRRYSFDIQLIDARGTLIDDYATNFDSPGAGLFNLFYIETVYRQERIQPESNRPVIQSRPTSLPSDDYTTYYRGWIPLYGSLATDDENGQVAEEDGERAIIAWIVATIYIERPDFNKPIRAVLAASTVDDWRTSYFLAEYVDGQLGKSAVKGIYASQPKYRRLGERERQIARTDSIAFISNLTSHGTYRELLLNRGEESVIKASTPLPALNNHIFAYFRFNVVLLIAGLVLFPLFSLLGLRTFSLFSQSRRFQSRLLDGLALATLLFLVLLVVATQYAVNHQNENNLKREMVTKLDNLAEAVLFEQRQQAAAGSEFIPLSRISSPLNADAIFYRDQYVAETTAPQIFQQHLLPQILPYPVHDFLYNRQRTHDTRIVSIGNEMMMVGYRLIITEEDVPLGVVAIPTFLQSPLYMEQLLETTSYLLVTYLLIFGIFIIGTVLMAARLTRPLHYIQEGLNRISGGDLETTLTVRSQDEIGALSVAYNTMVEKLKKLQTELARAEREAAWKEMARQVAHEIKNPLTPMKLNLQHLKRQLQNEPDPDSKLHRNIERVTANIIEQIESLNKIAPEFSNFASPVNVGFPRVALDGVISAVAEVDELEDASEPDHNGQIRPALTKEPLEVMGSDEDLRRALINLVKNSFEATESDTRLEVRSARNEKMAVIEIEDNGAGISEEVREKIFVPNFSTKSSGTGLGLAITKKIIVAHGGEITFRSEVGSGTIFTIRLPLANGSST